MSKGPLFNNIKRDFATRNSMGYDEVINSLQDKASPIITNVTENVFYIAFIVWSMNDYINSTDYSERTNANMNKHFKLQNFFFTTSFLLKNIELSGASGSSYIRDYINKNNSDIFEYNEDYIETLQTTIGYYKPGLVPLFLIKNETLEGEILKYSQVTPYGKELANVFESEIKDTEYFKSYRNSTTVPRKVLLELGNKVNLYMRGMTKLQKKIEEVLFDNKYNKENLKALSLDKDYLLYTRNKYKCNLKKELRKIEFDYYSPRGFNYELPVELRKTANNWEIIMGRQYYTFGLSMIWKHMLFLLDEPMTEEKWIDKALKKIKEDLSDITIEQLKEDCNYSCEEIDNMAKLNIKQVESNLLVDGLKLILFIYNRFENRNDLGKEYDVMFGKKDAYDTMPLISFFESVKKHKKEKVIDFLEILMKRLIIQNKIIGFKKIQNGKNGYYYEYSNGYYFKISDFEYDYAGNRLFNVIKALEDLNMMGDENNE